MSQTAAILVDAYRELNARRMFWVTLILSGLFIGSFALFGADDSKLTFLSFEWPMPMARTWYKAYLLQLALVTVWLTWAAVILALISTASIFPDFMAGGSIDLFLAKPIGRLRLFLTKYLSAMLFVVLQATVFAVAAFVVVGVRAGEWKPSLFLAIPLITVFYSYLYAVCVLLGAWTRSGIAALLLTMLFWLAVFGVHWAEYLTLYFKLQSEAYAELHEQRVADADAEIARVRAEKSALNMLGMQESSIREKRDAAARTAGRRRESAAQAGRWHAALYAVKTVLPKTSETVGLLDRKLFERSERDAFGEQQAGDGQGRRARIGDADWSLDLQAQQLAQRRLQDESLSRSTGWVIGTSLAFEAVVLAAAAWVFCRRDY